MSAISTALALASISSCFLLYSILLLRGQRKTLQKARESFDDLLADASRSNLFNEALSQTYAACFEEIRALAAIQFNYLHSVSYQKHCPEGFSKSFTSFAILSHELRELMADGPKMRDSIKAHLIAGASALEVAQTILAKFSTMRQEIQAEIQAEFDTLPKTA